MKDIKNRTLIGIDYGTKHTGVAVKAAGTMSALPLHTFECDVEDRQKLVDHVLHICKVHECDGIVIGLPLSMDGKQNDMTVKTSLIVHDIQKAAGLPVFHEDERLTSKAAGDHDKAAALILQSFIDRASRA